MYNFFFPSINSHIALRLHTHTHIFSHFAKREIEEKPPPKRGSQKSEGRIFVSSPPPPPQRYQEAWSSEVAQPPPNFVNFPFFNKVLRSETAQLHRSNKRVWGSFCSRRIGVVLYFCFFTWFLSLSPAFARSRMCGFDFYLFLRELREGGGHWQIAIRRLHHHTQRERREGQCLSVRLFVWSLINSLK